MPATGSTGQIASATPGSTVRPAKTHQSRPGPIINRTRRRDAVDQPTVAKPPENAGPTAEEVEQAQEQMTGARCRRSAVSASLESLKRQQEQMASACAGIWRQRMPA